jgi:ATP-binding cassette subfamily F protein 3
MGYIAQDVEVSNYETVKDFMRDIFKELLCLESRLRELESLMSLKEVYEDNNRLNSLMNQYSALTETYTENGGYEFRSRVRGVLNGLGMENDHTKISSLSGGQKTRLALARLLLESPDLLMIDEPTNYLDLESVQWLESYLKDYQKSLLVVSHDRFFLDNIVTQIFEIENSRISIYKGNYSDFVNKKLKRTEIVQRHNSLKQKEIDHLKKNIQNLVSQRKHIQAKSRTKKLEKLLPKIVNVKNHKHLNLRIEATQPSGKEVLKIHDLSFSYDNKQILSNVNINVFRGDRIGIIGPNGIGKTTFLKIISGELEPASGTIVFGHNVKRAFLAQEKEFLDQNATILEDVQRAVPYLSQSKIRAFLGNLLFSGDEVEKIISVLSGGEKSRVALAKEILRGSNLLLLDEPTNHLDIASKEKLEEELKRFRGTMIAVSHDRYFLSKVTNRIWEFSKDGIRDYFGDYSYYIDKKRQEEKNDAAIVKDNKTQLRKAKLSERRQREQKKQSVIFQKQLEHTILAKELEMEELELLMCKQEIYSNPDKSKKVNISYKILLQELEELYDKLSMGK